jgi:hypothetical protein
VFILSEAHAKGNAYGLLDGIIVYQPGPQEPEPEPEPARTKAMH